MGFWYFCMIYLFPTISFKNVCMQIVMADSNNVYFGVQFSSVQLLSRARLFATPWIAARQASLPSPTPGVHWDSRPSSQWCHPAISSSVVPFSSCPQSSQHQSLFQWVNSSYEVAKYWSLSFSIIPSKDIPGLISLESYWNVNFRKMDG